MREALDFDRPIALMLIAVLHFIDEEQDPYGIVKTLLDALAPGSFLIMSHGTGDFGDLAQTEAGKEVYRRAAAQATRAPARRSSGSWRAWSWSSPAWWSSPSGVRSPPRRPRCGHRVMPWWPGSSSR